MAQITRPTTYLNYFIGSINRLFIGENSQAHSFHRSRHSVIIDYSNREKNFGFMGQFIKQNLFHASIHGLFMGQFIKQNLFHASIHGLFTGQFIKRNSFHASKHGLFVGQIIKRKSFHASINAPVNLELLSFKI